ncbi:MAG: type IV pilus modification PilV family protein [Woeseiaceae bacterium]
MRSLLHYEHGVTLVELLVSIVVVSIAASAVLGVISMNTARSADPMIRHQAAAIAESYIEEILLKPANDPDGVDGEAARSDFDDLDDYDGLVDAGAHDQFGTPLPGLGDYNVAVTVVPSSALPAVPVADALRIDVVVTHANSINFAISGYRTRF